MKPVDQVPSSGFGDLLVKSLAICAVVFAVLYFTVLKDSHAQTTSIEIFPPWSGSYIANTWSVPVTPGKAGVAVVPNRYLLMTQQNQVVGELVNKADAVNALYGAELQAAVRDFMAVTATGTIPPGVLNTFRTRVGPVLTAIDAAK